MTKQDSKAIQRTMTTTGKVGGNFSLAAIAATLGVLACAGCGGDSSAQSEDPYEVRVEQQNGVTIINVGEDLLFPGFSEDGRYAVGCLNRVVVHRLGTEQAWASPRVIGGKYADCYMDNSGEQVVAARGVWVEDEEGEKWRRLQVEWFSFPSMKTVKTALVPLADRRRHPDIDDGPFSLYNVQFLGHGRKIAYPFWDVDRWQGLAVFDLETGDLQTQSYTYGPCGDRVVEGNAWQVEVLAYQEEENVFIVQSGPSTISLIDATTLEEITSVCAQLPKDRLNLLMTTGAYVPWLNRLLIVGSNFEEPTQMMVHTDDNNRMEPVAISGHWVHVPSVALTKDRKTALAVSVGGAGRLSDVCVIDMETAKETHVARIVLPNASMLAVSPDGQQVVFHYDDGMIVVPLEDILTKTVVGG